MNATPSSLLRVCRLSKRYVQTSWLSREHSVEAVRDVDLEIAAGTTLAVVGESGSGKSTLARCIARLEQPDSGEIWFEQREIARLGETELRSFRSQIQLVFQHSAGAMNPRFTAADAIEEPLLLQRRGAVAERKSRVTRALEEVGLDPGCAARRILEFSGGQRQRLAIARALVLEPRFLILDEAFTGLDLPIQAQILDLLLALQREHQLTYLLISHDLEIVEQIADEIAVMYRGQIVEHGPTARLLRSPGHEYTQALVNAQAALSGVVSA
jgi:peptide/nickel transport system ATP-binding protein/glutathione transport system ATP-binding protein